MRLNDSLMLFFVGFLSFAGGACQTQTNTIGLCESLQQQGADATCWLRDELRPAQLVAPQVLFGNESDSLATVLERVAKDRQLILKDGVQFENEVSRFKVQCAPRASKGDNCELTLISNPKVPMDRAFAAPLLEAINWVKSRTAHFKLTLLEKSNEERSLSVQIQNDDVSIEWSDTGARLIQ